MLGNHTKEWGRLSVGANGRRNGKRLLPMPWVKLGDRAGEQLKLTLGRRKGRSLDGGWPALGGTE